LQDTQDYKVWREREVFIIATIIGLLTGVAAWAFRLLIGLIHNLAFYGHFSVDYDANLHADPSTWGWFVIFVPVIGGVGVIWLIKNFAPEAKGHGVPEVMDAVYHRQGRMRGGVSIVKAFASALTIGTGGSLGREGPIVMICSAFSSTIGQWLKMPMSQRNLMIACGAAGGIAATFNAPLGGIMFAIELLLLSVNRYTVVPVIISAVIAANIGRWLIGPDPAFHISTTDLVVGADSPLILAIYFPFAALVGLVALLFIRGIYWSEEWFEQLPLGPYQRHMLGMLILGLLFQGMYLYFGHYYVQGVGYATIQDLVTRTLTSPGFILLILGAKMLATMLTIGSGGSGGVFSPSLFLGATLGGAFGYGLVALFPEIGVDPAAFALVGMASMVAATTSAPMTAAIMTYEMTLDYGVVLPVMVGVAVAYAVRHHFSEGDIYTIKLLRRGRNVPQGRYTDLNSHVVIDDIMDTSIKFVKADDLITGSDQTCCVINDEGAVIGVIYSISYRKGIEFRARDAMVTEFITVQSGMTLRQVFQKIKKHEQSVAMVTTDGSINAKKVTGVVSPFNLTLAMAHASQLHV
jgi:chloride channel protein, CIC family